MGLGSRRQVDRWVVEGRITIDGRAAKPGDQLTGKERVCVDGRPIKRAAKRQAAAPQPSFAAFYKPSGRAASRESGESTVPLLALPTPPKHGRWIAVGALDTNAAGLLLLTTDGKLANGLTHPSAAIDHEFAVRLLGQPSAAQLRRLTDGVALDTGPVSADSVKSAGGGGTNVWYHVVMHDGGSRELRALLDAVGLPVSRVIRIRFGPVKLGTLRRGQSRALTRPEIDALYEIGTPKRTNVRPRVAR